jgi:DNA-directed RNA polymerase subunit K/omega
LTRFEVARLVGARALQVSLGAPILVKAEETNPIQISQKEFREKIIPITIKRKLPNSEEVVVEVKKGIENWLVDNKGEI